MGIDFMIILIILCIYFEDVVEEYIYVNIWVIFLSWKVKISDKYYYGWYWLLFISISV